MGTVEVSLKSIHSRERSFVRFINTTRYNVEIHWVNYEGQAILYNTLKPRDSVNIDTYVTHPWIFVEKHTRDRFVVEGKNVFISRVRCIRHPGMQRHELPERNERVQVYITVPIYSLRDVSLRVIKRLLRDDLHAFRLDIPLSLQQELASMWPSKSIDANP